jgi:hypothetical protein
MLTCKRASVIILEYDIFLSDMTLLFTAVVMFRAFSGRMMNKWWVGKHVEGRGCDLIRGTLPAFAWGTRKPQNADIEFMGRDLNPGLHQYEAGALSTWLQCLLTLILAKIDAGCDVVFHELDSSRFMLDVWMFLFVCYLDNNKEAHQLVAGK